jgi:outer membrane protein assembly factor BamB
VYIGSFDKNLYCLDAQTGSVVWKYLTNYRIRSSPALKDGKLYTGADDGNVYCLDANTGTLIWKNKLSDLIMVNVELSPVAIRSSPTVVGDRVYVGHVDNNVYCLDVQTGDEIWSFSTGSTVVSSPAVAAGKVYIGSGDRNIYCINADDGTPLWSYNCGENEAVKARGEVREQVNGSPTIIEDLNMVVFFANANAVYYALDMDTGNLIWSYWSFKMRPYIYAQVTQATTYCTPAYSEETNSLYVIDDFFAQRLDVVTGRALWPLYGTPVSQEPEGPLNIPTGEATGPGYPGAVCGPNDLGFINICSPAYADGKVYFGGHRESFYCFDATSLDAERLSWYQTGGYIDSSPAIAYGYTYVGSTNWNIYCFTDGSPRKLDPNEATRTVPLLDPTTITGTISTNEVEVNDWIYIEGKVGYEPDATVWERAVVFATFTRPDGTSWDANMMADWGGTYKISYRPDLDGTWTVKPWWLGDIYNAGVEGTALTFNVKALTLPQPKPLSPPSVLPTTYILAILAAAAIAIIAVVSLLLRRK